MIKNIVFDIGNVLFDYDPVYILAQLLPGSSEHELYLHHLFLDPIWDALDRGDESRDSVISTLRHRLTLSDSQCQNIGLLIDHFVDHLQLNKDMSRLFVQLCDIFPVYLLSNFQDKPFDRLYANNPFLNQNSGMIISAKETMMKPELQIYRLLLNRYDLVAQETIFIDDRLENIEACRVCGIHGIHFLNAQQCRDALIDHGVKI